MSLLKLSRTKRLCVIVGSFNFILGVALTGIQAERKLDEIGQGLVPHGLRIDRCVTGFEVQKISNFPCNERGSTNEKTNQDTPQRTTTNARRSN